VEIGLFRLFFWFALLRQVDPAGPMAVFGPRLLWVNGPGEIDDAMERAALSLTLLE
jgi:hypothetical protein